MITGLAGTNLRALTEFCEENGAMVHVGTRAPRDDPDGPTFDCLD
ncbi:hypothetical protein [Haloferax prahovense]|nr:hypothetical protein [Haloferax prahovense]